MKNGDTLVGIVFVCVMLFAGGTTGYSLASHHKDSEWRNALVDRPEYIEAIKGEVLAKRAVKELKE